jgi:hypothetical protein
MPVIPAILEADIGKMIVQGQPRKKVGKTPFQQKNKCTSVSKGMCEA